MQLKKHHLFLYNSSKQTDLESNSIYNSIQKDQLPRIRFNQYVNGFTPLIAERKNTSLNSKIFVCSKTNLCTWTGRQYYDGNTTSDG